MVVGLTQRTLDNLFQIYKEVFESESEFPKLKDVEKAIKQWNYYDYIAGSKWSQLSKFTIDDTTIKFTSNYTSKGKEEAAEIEEARAEFNRRVNEYLTSLQA